MSEDRLKNALAEDTALLTSLLSVLDDLKNRKLESLGTAETMEDIRRYQGEIRCLRELRAKFVSYSKSEAVQQLPRLIRR